MAISKLRFLALLAAAVAVTAACDPFPAKPSGPPTIEKAIASGAFTAEVDAPYADLNAIVVDDAAQDSVLYIWFNKPMDGSTIQAFPDVDPKTGTTPLDPLRPNPDYPTKSSVPFLAVQNTCELARSPLEPTSALPAGSSICFTPSSPILGGLLAVTAPPPAVADGVPLFVAGSYEVGGTVND
ncbi:MAG TPA: hypothetical protein VFP50_09580, partial [Anaeromyxobacteraceae bacterium]|nr:hypothetical protein [Anaeromyxobacteraceae bacterium]